MHQGHGSLFRNVAVLALVSTLGLAGCINGLIGGDQPVTDTVTGEWIAIYFTSPLYPDDPNTRPTGMDANLVALIDAAQERVDVAGYDIDLGSVSDALIRARQANVQVRVVTDESNADEEAVTRLRQAEIPVTARPEEGWGIMHHKFVVVDSTWVWTGSWNMTENGTFRNNNNAVLIASRSLARDYTAEFEEMFSGQFGPSSPANTPHPLINVEGEGFSAQLEVYFAPEDGVASHILGTLSDAQSYVRFLAFQFTSEELADALIDLREEGVQVVGVLEARDADRPYSQRARLVSGGVTVWTDGNPYIMHHKVIIVDDDTVILGSYNFTNNAEDNNDENVLIIHDSEVAASFLAEFGRVLQEAQTAEP